MGGTRVSLIGTITRLALATSGLVFLLAWLTVFGAGAVGSPNDVIAFTSTRTGTSDIYLMDVDSSLTYNLTRHPADDLGPAWSPHTGALAFYSDRNGDGAAELYQMTMDGRGTQQLVSRLENLWSPRWSPDGQRLVFIRDFGSIFVTDTDGEHAVWLGYGFSPAWSPTDARIALYSNPRSDYGDIYLIDADGHNRRNLTLNGSDDWSPAWSPDGTRIAFLSSRDGTTSEVYVMDAGCSAPCPAQRLTYNDTMELSLAFSPDGALIVFEAEVAGKSQLFLMNADGSNPRPLGSSDGENRTPTFIG